MKRFIYTLFAVLLVSCTVNAQEPTETAVSQGADALMKSKTSGEYSFVLPSNLTNDDVAKSSKYYTHYFTVDFSEGTHEASVHMVNNDEKSRIVVTRFLSSCGVRFVKVGNSNLSLDEFSNTYFK